MVRKYYAEVATWGRDKNTTVCFDTKKERDEFTSKTDYTSKVKAADAKGAISYNEYKAWEQL